MDSRYFDNAATTSLDRRVLDEMMPYLTDNFGNPNSLHSVGRKALNGVEKARQRIANAIQAEDPSQVVFTSGATESHNWLLNSFKGSKGAISSFEHSSVRAVAAKLGFEVLPIDEGSMQFPSRSYDFLSLTSVSNETGTAISPEDFREFGEVLHSDITQCLGKLPFTVGDLDFISSSGHKIYGPKGVGFLYARDFFPEPEQLGGDQELGFRAGTLNVASIVGLGLACEIAVAEQPQRQNHAEELNQVLLSELSQIPDVLTNGGDHRSPFILSLSFYGIEGESLLIDLDGQGFSLSAGSACSSRNVAASPVLVALGLEPGWLRGTIRVSFGNYNTRETTVALAKAMTRSVAHLRS